MTEAFKVWAQKVEDESEGGNGLYDRWRDDAHFWLTAFVREVEKDAAINGPVPHNDISKRDIGEALYRIARDFGLEATDETK